VESVVDLVGSARLRRLKKVARKPGRLAKKATKLVGKGMSVATGPIRRRIFRAFFRKLIFRRARLISWQRRKSLQPLPEEQRQARGWAAGYVRRKGGLLGKLVGAAMSGDFIGEPATSALITASIPILIQLAHRALRAAEREGAPADPRMADEVRENDGE
jgi:hypothetical protein